MKRNKKWISIAYIMIGIILIALAFFEIVDEFWNGVGFGLGIIGVLQLIRILRFENNKAYREKVEIETNDERNHFIRNKAWAWAGYFFVLISAVATIVLRIMKLELYANASAMFLCLMLILYWCAYYILKKKY